MLNFLGALELPPAAIYSHLLVASVDSHSKVSRRGDELVKKRAAGADLEDAALMRKLFSIFQGASQLYSWRTPSNLPGCRFHPDNTSNRRPSMAVYHLLFILRLQTYISFAFRSRARGLEKPLIQVYHLF